MENTVYRFKVCFENSEDFQYRYVVAMDETTAFYKMDRYIALQADMGFERMHYTEHPTVELENVIL